MKVQLIRPPLDDWYSPNQLRDLISVPAQLNLLAATIREEVDVEVIDGLSLPLETTLDKIDAGWLGVNDIFSYHQNAMQIMKTAKENGAKTIVGGPHVNHIANRILNNHQYVDYAVVGDGEEALPLLIAGEKEENIPNLVYRKDGEIVANPRKHLRPSIIFDLEDLVDWQAFDKDNFFPLAGIKGCVKAAQSKRCSFCAIDNRLKVMDPELYWQQVDILHSKYGVNKYWEGGDSFVVGNWPEKLLAARPGHLSQIGLKGYVTAKQVTPETVEILKALNFVEVFIGVESANDEILKNVDKGYSFADIERAVELFADWDIDGHFPFLYNLPGETSETAERTYRFAASLAERFPEAKYIASTVVILPGTEHFEMMRTNPKVRAEYPGDLDKDDVLDTGILSQLWSKHIVHTNHDEMREFVRKTWALAKEGAYSSFYIND
jgi:anaerobic magnesium-protoporphyrin IX monomethyl ester cyclase